MIIKILNLKNLKLIKVSNKHASFFHKSTSFPSLGVGEVGGRLLVFPLLVFPG